MPFIIKFFIDRLDERTTWRAIIGLLTIVGVNLSPEQTAAVISFGVSLGLLIEALIPENDETKVSQAIKKEVIEVKRKVSEQEEKKEESSNPFDDHSL